MNTDKYESFITASPVIAATKSESDAANIKKIASAINTETLVVVSKVKALVKNIAQEHLGSNISATSACAVDALTKKIVEEVIKGIVRAEKEGRKTLMGRDIE